MSNINSQDTDGPKPRVLQSVGLDEKCMKYRNRNVMGTEAGVWSDCFGLSVEKGQSGEWEHTDCYKWQTVRMQSPGCCIYINCLQSECAIPRFIVVPM